MSILSLFGDIEGFFEGKKVDTATASVDLQNYWQAVLGIAQVAEEVTTAAGLPAVAVAITTATDLIGPVIALIEAGGVATAPEIVTATNIAEGLFMLAVPHIKAVASVA